MSPPTPRSSGDNFSFKIRDLGLFERVFNLQSSEMCHLIEKKSINKLFKVDTEVIFLIFNYPNN